MSKHTGIKGVIVGAIIWFINHKTVCFVSIDEFIRLKNLGYKSINIKMIDNKDFNIVKIPSKEKRFYMDSDYSVLFKLEGKDE